MGAGAVDKATVSFQTREYTARTVLAHLEKASRQDKDARHSVFGLMSQESLKSRASFVREIVTGQLE
jgi:hypothetical protein